LELAAALGLEAAVAFRTVRARPLLIAATGRYPERTPPGVGWFSVLGADAARIAASALESVPVERTRDDAAVRRFHDKTRRALATASAALESSSETGFSGGRVLSREIDAVEVDGGGSP
jgi:hypothetical protein